MRRRLQCACGCGIRTVLQATEVRPFATNPQDTIDFLRNKIDIPTETWTDLWQQEHSIGFAVAGATNDALLKDFHDAVNKAVANGETLETFRKDFDNIVERYGWNYKGGRNWRSRVIFDTNMSTAYAAGRWQQIQRVKKQRPYLRYVHLEGQKHPRPLHASWHGLVLPVDDPWWQTHYPPNGWFCHCTVQSVSDDDLGRYGWQVADQAPEDDLVSYNIMQSDGSTRTVTVPAGIDPGFSYRPGELPAAVGGGVGF